MKAIKNRTIKIYKKEDGESPFVSWLESLDKMIRYRIKTRLDRVKLGNLGEYKLLGDSLGELKFVFGSGYRVYYGEVEGEIILLLSGGDKKSQTKDIKLAREYLSHYLRGKSHGQ